MSLSRTPYSESFTSVLEQCTLYGLIQGAGAAAPVVAPITASSTSSKSFMPRSVNWISLVATDITRSGVGVYTAKFIDGLPYVMDITPAVWGPSGTWGSIVDYNPTTRVVSFQTFAAGGSAGDLASTEFLRFTVTGALTTMPY